MRSQPLPFELLMGIASRAWRLSRSWQQARREGHIDKRQGLLYRQAEVRRERRLPTKPPLDGLDCFGCSK